MNKRFWIIYTVITVLSLALGIFNICNAISTLEKLNTLTELVNQVCY